MMMTREAFMPAFKQTRHGRLFELIRQSEGSFAAAPDPIVPELEMLAFRDMAAKSLFR